MVTSRWFSTLSAGLCTMAFVTGPGAELAPTDGPPVAETIADVLTTEIDAYTSVDPQDSDDSASWSLSAAPPAEEASSIATGSADELPTAMLRHGRSGGFSVSLTNDDGSQVVRLRLQGTVMVGNGGLRETSSPGPATPAPSGPTAPAPPDQPTGSVTPPTTSSVTPATPDLSAGSDLVVLHREILAGNLFNLYSPETGTVTPSGLQPIWLGGWDKLASRPWDRIFLGHLDGSRLLPTLTTAVAVAGAAVNDPTVIQVPGSSDRRMYFTVLASEHFNEGTEHNVVWTARSTDDGATWHGAQEVIGPTNGVNSCGAWSPSAIAEGSRICVYYHGNSPCLGVYRSCFLPDGLTPAQPTEELSLPFGLANVHVFRADDRYVLVGDALGLSSFTEIRALESADGQTWQPLNGSENGLLVRAENGVVFTPHISDVSGSVLTLLFTTRASFDVDAGTNILHRWTIDTRPTN